MRKTGRQGTSKTTSSGGGRKQRKRFDRSWDIELDIGGALSPPLPAERGVSQRELAILAARGEEVVRQLQGRRAESGFLKLPGRGAGFLAIARAARRWRRRDVRDVIQVGIGGSSLGAEMWVRALAHPYHNDLPDSRRPGPRVHFVDNVDPERLAALLEVVDLRRALIHLVSKSGGTVESAASFQILRDALERALPARRRPDALHKHVVVTTGRGPLREFAKKHDVEVLDFPEDIGGRFSALTASGLFVPALLGIDIATLRAGAQRYVKRVSRAPGVDNPSAMAAAVAHALAQRHGINLQVTMPYADSLEALSRFMVQLTGESLGKRDPSASLSQSVANGVGVTPLPARGTTDQHSQVQLFVEGPADKLIVFVNATQSRREIRLPKKLAAGDPADYLAGLPLGDLLRAEQEGTAIALAAAQRPWMTWQLYEVHPYTLGQLVVALELQTAIHAALLGVDAYDQPGVEAGKIAAFALIGREGFEAERERILRSRVSKSWVGKEGPR